MMAQTPRRADHQKAEDKFQTLRDMTYDVTRQEFDDITVGSISLQLCQEADRWKHQTNGRPQRASWEWCKEYPFYQRRPNRFEIALSKGGVLGALCYGQLSKQGSRLRMNLIESTPIRPTPLGQRALPILSFAAAVFADICGADELWVLDPDPNLEGLYQSEGFGQREIYHGRRVGQRRIL
ncbi:hypothetical protein L1F30_15025 [Simiduia sp. 21SJ11W-1]|uniref:hypothetical protein n=1 Tax=Simiduia sp. 21SJ11W-1 TaxID=2909669 RepID=UPI00209E5C71|nr:hypothetical protein [Simiduia sp. 21SJ11W-1]UTA47460.1 hypothetical protein L1F30_15025 [Simiduia sp. 21SJ11W-1]